MKHLTGYSLAAHSFSLTVPALFGWRRKGDCRVRIADARQLSPYAIADLKLATIADTPVCKIRLVGAREFFDAAVGDDAVELYETLLARWRRHHEGQRSAPCVPPSDARQDATG